MNIYPVGWTLTFCIAMAAGLLSACGGSADPGQLVSSAKAYLDKGEPRAAAIELKTALQKSPNLPEARYLLGKAFLANDEPVVAAVELRKALELKYPRDDVVPVLARAMLEQGRHKEIIAEYSGVVLGNMEAQASLKTYVGQAQTRIGDGAQAMAAYKLALEALPGYVPALNGLARQRAISGEREVAAQAVAEIIASGKADADTYLLQGDLLAFTKGDRAEALGAYRKALATTRSHFQAHASIIQLLLSSGDAKAAAEQVEQLNKIRPGHPATRYFQAQVAYLQKNDKVAKELVLQLLKNAPDNPYLNQLAGAIELSSGSNAAALAYLNKALQVAPESSTARRLLASAYLKAGESSKALELLQPSLTDTSQDSVALALAGEALMQGGDLERASAMFARAAKLNPANVGNLTALARTRFLKGDADGAVADLQSIAASDAGTVADLELITTQMRRRDTKGALKAIDDYERKSPGKPLTEQLRGAVHLGNRDAASARSAFQRALSIDPAYFPAAANLAALDIADKQPQVAQQRFEGILKIQPGSVRATLALAELRTRNGASRQEVAELLTNCVRLNPDDVSAHLSLVNFLLAGKQAESALAAAQQAAGVLPSQPQILDALGRSQQAAGQPNQALATFNKLIALQPGDPLAHLRIADIKIAAKDNVAAVESLQRAVAAKPDAVLPVQRLIALHVQGERYKEALKLARDLQSRQPAQSLGYVFEGDVLRSQKNDAAALTVYKTALGKASPEIASPRFHSLLIAMGKKAEADQFAKTWFREHANDLGFGTYLGDAALARKDFVGAEAAYRHVLERSPNHVASLNNVAWLMAKAGRTGGIALAERANELQPNQPPLMDTMALALAAEKRIDQALEVQKRAVALAPDNTSLRLTLARLYLQAQQKPQAREILEALNKLGDKLAEQTEVKSLLAGL